MTMLTPRRQRHFASITVLCLCAFPIAVTADFANLGFELARVPPGTPPGPVAVQDAVPGWEVLINDQEQQTVLFNTGTLGASSLSLLDSSLAPVVDGRYALGIYAGTDPSDPMLPASVTLRQRGFIAGDVQTLYFKGYFGGAIGRVSDIALRVDGSRIQIVTCATAPNYSLYGVDLSAYSGLNAELSLTALSDLARGPTVLFLDSFSFSSNPIPEPGLLALFAAGTAFLSVLSRRRRKHGNHERLPGLHRQVGVLRKKAMGSNINY